MIEIEKNTNIYNTAKTKEAEQERAIEKVRAQLLRMEVPEIPFNNFKSILDKNISHAYEDEMINNRFVNNGQLNTSYTYFKDPLYHTYYQSFYKTMFSLIVDDEILSCPVPRLAKAFYTLYLEYELYKTLSDLKGFDFLGYAYGTAAKHKTLRLAARRCGVAFTHSPDFVNEMILNQSVSELAGVTFSPGVEVGFIFDKLKYEFSLPSDRRFKFNNALGLSEKQKDELPWVYKYLMIKVVFYREMVKALNNTYYPSEGFAELKGFDPVSYNNSGEGKADASLAQNSALVFCLIGFILMMMFASIAPIVSIIICIVTVALIVWALSGFGKKFDK